MIPTFRIAGIGMSGKAATGGGGAGGGGAPSRSQLLTMDYVFNGLPFVQVEAQPLATVSLDFVFNGLPFVGS